MMSRSASLTEARRQHARRILALVALCTSASPLETHAQASASVELDWHAPADCPSAGDVLRRIDALAGSSSAAAEPLRVEATITRSRRGQLQLKLLVQSGDISGERRIEGKSCDDLAGAAAVNVVLLLQSAAPLPAAGLQASDAARGADPLPAAPVRASPRATADPQPHAAEAGDDGSGQPFRVLLQLPIVSSNLGLLPEANLGAGLAAGLSFGRAIVQAEGNYWFPQAWPAEQRPDSGATVHRIEASLRGCWVFELAWLDLAPCVAASLEHVWARGEGARVAARTAATTWVAAELGGRARLPLTSWLGLVVAAEAQIGMARPVVSIDGLGRVGQLGPAAVELGLGAEWIL